VLGEVGSNTIEVGRLTARQDVSGQPRELRYFAAGIATEPKLTFEIVGLDTDEAAHWDWRRPSVVVGRYP